MKKQILSLALAFILLLGGCAADTVTQESDDGKIKVITTNFPPYDFARQIAGENADVRMLLPPGAETHDYEPTPQDIIDIGNCDVFIYTGGENDAWVDELLSGVGADVRIVRMMDAVDVYVEEIVEGMQDDGEEEEAEYDEHVWLSPLNAVKISRATRDALTLADPTNADAYKSGCDAYIAQLESLDADIRDAVAGASLDTLVFGDRFPARYFTEEYGLD
jgi:zinc transport system substrate-binding protein